MKTMDVLVVSIMSNKLNHRVASLLQRTKEEIAMKSPSDVRKKIKDLPKKLPCKGARV